MVEYRGYRTVRIYGPVVLTSGMRPEECLAVEMDLKGLPSQNIIIHENFFSLGEFLFEISYRITRKRDKKIALLARKRGKISKETFLFFCTNF